MTTATPNHRQRWLRNSLLGNAVFSTLSGLTFALAAGAVADLIGLEQVALVRAAGIGLLITMPLGVILMTQSFADLAPTTRVQAPAENTVADDSPTARDDTEANDTAEDTDADDTAEDTETSEGG